MMERVNLYSENGRSGAAERCPLCGYRFDMSEMPERGCRICPMKRSCDALICPNCGYCQPQTTRTEAALRRLAGWVRALFRPAAAAGDPKRVRLRDLKRMSWARVLEVNAKSPDTEARLAGMCILPGVVFQVRQQRPAAVVRVDETMLAIDRALAERIWVEPLEGRESTEKMWAAPSQP
ncbi:MAG: ferrous iron transport protein A [Nitrospinaceae bacterium]|jgi:Fe2+ transport system protein FeoA|nr:ferrous iron transport protein A [Nitrospinaceae bacterium]MBT5946270.1 ferrous iron transport protein A [Nitrospinaceae bacterium]MBT6395206.1 ferrous iron transport protein A [Nitrospinaceae bacterium]